MMDIKSFRLDADGDLSQIFCPPDTRILGVCWTDGCPHITLGFVHETAADDEERNFMVVYAEGGIDPDVQSPIDVVVDDEGRIRVVTEVNL